MANPQVENGHLKIANEVWDHLTLAPLTASEFQVVFAVIRATWGWKKKQAHISISELQKMTGQPERTVCRSLDSLTHKNIILCVRGGGRGNSSKWSFNKDWETWKISLISLPKMAEKINSAKINSVLNGSQTLPPATEFSAINGRVSDCNLFETKEQLAPKAIFKASKANRGAKAPRPKDQAYEIFATEFLEHRQIPYRSLKGDFVQLAALRKATGENGQPAHWIDAIHNYFGTPLSRYTLADLCSRFDVFVASKLDRFGKPEDSPQHHEQSLTEYYEKTFDAIRAKKHDND